MNKKVNVISYDGEEISGVLLSDVDVGYNTDMGKPLYAIVIYLEEDIEPKDDLNLPVLIFANKEKRLFVDPLTKEEIKQDYYVEHHNTPYINISLEFVLNLLSIWSK